MLQSLQVLKLKSFKTVPLYPWGLGYEREGRERFMGVPEPLSHRDRGTVACGSMLLFFYLLASFLFHCTCIHSFTHHSLINGQLLHTRHRARC